jgi:hypothetical protein
MRSFSFICMLAMVVLVFTCGPAASAQDHSPAGAIAVADARLGTGIENRALTGEDSSFAAGSSVTLWMKVTGGSGETLTVTWENGAVKHATTLSVGGSPWRTWATKSVGKAGQWTVTVADSRGAQLKELHFTVR